MRRLGRRKRPRQGCALPRLVHDGRDERGHLRGLQTLEQPRGQSLPHQEIALAVDPGEGPALRREGPPLDVPEVAEDGQDAIEPTSERLGPGSDPA